MAAACVACGGAPPSAPPAQPPPRAGQPGKDVNWVATPPELIDLMLDMARVTPSDFVVDLGSGDGRNIIAAAKRGAQGLGVEYNSELVSLSRRLAAQAGVAERARFVQGDMFKADFSKASVLALFLLPDNMNRLRDKFLQLKPGTRIVANANTGMEGWAPDEGQQLDEDCTTWCMALMWIVPARVEGAWTLPRGELTLKQQFQLVSGTLLLHGSTMPITGGRLRGSAISFEAGGSRFAGRVETDVIEGTVSSAEGTAPWRATRAHASAAH